MQAAAGFLDHLDATPPHARNKFEQAFYKEEDLYLEPEFTQDTWTN